MIDKLPRREREVFELLCAAKEVTAAGLRAEMRDAPSYSAVRTWLSRLEAKGFVTHRVIEQTYVYAPVPQQAKIRRSALQKLVDTFFDGSGASAATALLGLSKTITPEELEALQKAIERARQRQ
jgi:predicted transcriptional regulator